ncbi:MAG: hypothetical protein ACE5K7_03350, partial [Phycisphaerae bacterium]
MRPAHARGRLLIAAGALVLYTHGARIDAAQPQAQDLTKTALAIPTFHCLGLYWSPEGGSAEREVVVRYRRQGSEAWSEALPMRYNPIPGTDEDLADYRGSIVHLQPATSYEIELTLAGTQT